MTYRVYNTDLFSRETEFKDFENLDQAQAYWQSIPVEGYGCSVNLMKIINDLDGETHEEVVQNKRDPKW